MPQAKNQPVKDIESSYSKINQSMKNHSSSKSSKPTKSAPLSNGRNNSNDSNSSTGFENAVLRFYSKISPLKCFLFILLICILIIVAIVITVLVIIHKHPRRFFISQRAIPRRIKNRKFLVFLRFHGQGSVFMIFQCAKTHRETS